MKMKKDGILTLILCGCLVLTGCRTRTTGVATTVSVPEETGFSEPLGGNAPGEESADEPEPESAPEEAEGLGERTRENPEASRKEYDESAPAEILPGLEREIHTGGEGSGASAEGSEEGEIVSKLKDSAEEPATQKVASQEAERMGTSEDGEEADSAMTYYTVLLADRMGNLFECQRLCAYWETQLDHVTVFKTSPEHSLMLGAGVYDVSARLLAENLRVDDGWISRKNPGLIIKVVSGGVLGGGVFSAAAAEGVYTELLSRPNWASIDAVRKGRVLLLSEELLEAPYLQTAAMVAIAKCANPELMADTDPDQALEQLAEEATGTIPTGIYFYAEGM